MAACCKSFGCCTQPHGPEKYVRGAQTLSIVALVVSLVTSPVLFFIGLIAPVIILSTSCTDINKAGLVIASIFAFVCSAFGIFLTIVAIASDGNDCGDAQNGQKVCESDGLVVFLGIMNTIIWALLGFLALQMPMSLTTQPLLVSADDEENARTNATNSAAPMS